MKKIMMVVMLMVSPCVLADGWKKMAHDNNKTVYFSPKSKRITDTGVKLWVMNDYDVEQEINDEKFLSDHILFLTNCIEELVTPVSMVVFRGKGGTGGVVFSDNVPARWMPPSPGSLGESIIKVSCRKEE